MERLQPTYTPPSGAPATSYVTGDRTASITVTDNNVLDGASADSKQVDGSFTASVAGSNAFRNLYSRGSVTFDFGAGAKKCVNGFKWYQSTTSSHGTHWQLWGGDELGNWTMLVNNFKLGGASGANEYLFVNNDGYRYYMLINRDPLTDNSENTSSSPWLEETEFKQADAAAAAIINTSSPSYLNRGGVGARSSIITLTTNATTAGAGGNLSNLIDGKAMPQTGSEGNTQSWSWTNGQSNIWLQFDFGTPAPVMTEFTWYQATAVSTHGTWKVQASANGIDWTDLTSTFTLGGSLVQTVSFSNTVAYRYYRLLQTSGTTNSTPWLREIEFKLHY